MYTSQSMCVSSAGDVHTRQQDKVNFNLCIPQKQNTAILLKQGLVIHIQKSLQRLLRMPPKWAITTIVLTQVSALSIHQLQW